MRRCERFGESQTSGKFFRLSALLQTVDLRRSFRRNCLTKGEVSTMKTRPAFLFVLFAVLALPAVPAMAAPCESLSSLKLANTTITAAESVAAAAGARGGAAMPAHCRVRATIRPTSDSEIKIEVWMPATGWNGKF